MFEAQTRGVLQALGWPQSVQGASVDLQSDSLLTANALTKGVEYLDIIGYNFTEKWKRARVQNWI